MAIDVTQTAIPFLLMRGGTSRGPFFRRDDLPSDRGALSDALIRIIGAGDPRNIDGIGGGHPVTTKVAMLSRSADRVAEIDYFFAQVAVDKASVDYGPTCGNMLTAVAPAAIEMGLVKAMPDRTCIRVKAVNTGALIECAVETPRGVVRYQGTTAIPGVPGTAAPISLKFLDIVGSVTGSMFPTGSPIESINGRAATCIDVAMPLVILRAKDFGLSATETATSLNARPDLLQELEQTRLIAGRRMGLGDVSERVIPKLALIASPAADGHLSVRYFTPWVCHPTIAVTGSLCISAALLCSKTICDTDDLASPEVVDGRIAIEHPAGINEVVVRLDQSDSGISLREAGVVRTARLLVRGDVYLPRA